MKIIKISQSVFSDPDSSKTKIIQCPHDYKSHPTPTQDVDTFCRYKHNKYSIEKKRLCLVLEGASDISTKAGDNQKETLPTD
jgi:hypothetical protein